MGSFYANFSVQGDNPDAVAAVLRTGGRHALVTSPNVHFPYCAVFDREADSLGDEALDWVGGRVSAECGPVLAVVNCDSDYLSYWLYDRGGLVDRYSSASSRFHANYHPDAPRGDSALLCRTLARLDDHERVEATLRGFYLYADDQHRALAFALGLHMYTVGRGYREVARLGGVERLFPGERLVWVVPDAEACAAPEPAS
jgi:hypothetical protein